MAKQFQVGAVLALSGVTGLNKIKTQIQSGLASVNTNVNVNVKLNKAVANNIHSLNSKLNALNRTLVTTTANTKTLAAAFVGLGAAARLNANALQNMNTNLSNLYKTNVNVSKGITTTHDAIEKLGTASGLALKRFAAYSVATIAVGGLAAATTGALKEALDFERELIKVAQVTGKTTSELSTLTAEITNLSTKFGVSSKGLISTAQILAQAGLSAKDTTIALEALAKTQLSPTFDDINETTEGSIALMQQFGVEAKDLEKKLSSLNAVSGQFAVESSDLITAIRRAGGAFKASGGTFEEFIALFTSIRQTTRESAESIATGFRTIFARLQRPTTIKYLEELGIQLSNLNGQFVGPFEAVRRLQIGLAKLETTDVRFAQVIEELGGFRQISKVIPLIQQFDVSQRALAVGMRGTDTLSKDAATAQESLLIQLTKVKEEFINLFRVVLDNRAFRNFIELTLTLTKSLTQLAKTFEPIIPLIGAIGLTQGASIANRFRKGIPAAFRAGGGYVPGQGSGDRIPIMAEAGEFVIRKKAANELGAAALHKLNNADRIRSGEITGKGKTQRFANGGFVKGYAGGGLVSGGGIATLGVGALLFALPKLTDVFGDMTDEVTTMVLILGLLVKKFKLLDDGITGIQSKFKNLSSDISTYRRKNIAQLFTDARAKQSTIDPLGSLGAGTAQFNSRVSQRVERQKQVARLRLRDRLSSGVNAAILPAGLLGGAISSNASEKINAGGNNSGQAALGGGLGGAASGALLGSLVLPGLGTAVGALVGAIGGATFAFLEAEKQIKSVEFNKTFDKLKLSLDLVSKGKSTAQLQSASLRTGIAASQSRLLTASPDESSSILNQLRGEAIKIESFTRQLVTSAETASDLDVILGGVNKSLFEFQASILEIPFSQLREELLAEIKARDNRKKIDEKIAAGLQYLNSNILLFNDQLSAITSVSIALENFSAKVDTIASGFTTGFKPNNSALITAASEGSLGVLEPFEKLVNRLVRPQSANVANQTIDAARVIKQLPAILTESLVSQDPSKIDQVVSKRLEALQLDPAISQLISGKIKGATEGEGGDTAPIGDIKARVNELTKELADGLKPLFDALSKQVELENQFNDDLTKIFTARHSITDKIRDLTVRGAQLDVARRVEIGGLTGSRPSNLSLFNDARAQQQLSVGNIGVDANSPQALGRVLGLTTDALQEIQNKINNERSVDNLPALQREFAQAKDNANVLSKALENLTDVSKLGADALRDEIGERETGRQFRLNFVEGVLSNNFEENIGVAKNVSALGQANRQGNLQGIGSDERKGLFSLLGDIGDTRLAFLGNQKGSDVRETLVRGELENLLKQGLLPQGFQKSDIDTLAKIKPDDPLLKQLEEVHKTAIQANEELRNYNNKILSALDTKIPNQLTEIISLFKTANDNNAEDAKRRFNTDELSKKREELKGATAGSALRERLGVDELSPENIGALKSFRQLIPELEAFRKNKETLNSFGNIGAGQFDVLNSKVVVGENGQKIGLPLTKDDIESFFSNAKNREKFSKLGLNETELRSQFSTAQNSAGLFRQADIGGILQKAIDSRKQSLINQNTDISNNARAALGDNLEVQQLFSSLANENKSTFDKFKSAIESISREPKELNANLNSLEAAIKKLEESLKPAVGKANGGLIFKAGGGSIFKPRGTDTVPAMLTPGEFVVNAAATSRNLGLLHDINAGYYAKGGYTDSDEYKRKAAERHARGEAKWDQTKEEAKAGVADRLRGITSSNATQFKADDARRAKKVVPNDFTTMDGFLFKRQEQLIAEGYSADTARSVANQEYFNVGLKTEKSTPEYALDSLIQQNSLQKSQTKYEIQKQKDAEDAAKRQAEVDRNNNRDRRTKYRMFGSAGKDASLPAVGAAAGAATFGALASPGGPGAIAVGATAGAIIGAVGTSIGGIGFYGAQAIHNAIVGGPDYTKPYTPANPSPGPTSFPNTKRRIVESLDDPFGMKAEGNYDDFPLSRQAFFNVQDDVSPFKTAIGAGPNSPATKGNPLTKLSGGPKPLVHVRDYPGPAYDGPKPLRHVRDYPGPAYDGPKPLRHVRDYSPAELEALKNKGPKPLEHVRDWTPEELEALKNKPNGGVKIPASIGGIPTDFTPKPSGQPQKAGSRYNFTTTLPQRSIRSSRLSSKNDEEQMTRYANKRAEGLTRTELLKRGLKGDDYKNEYQKTLAKHTAAEQARVTGKTHGQLNAERIKRIQDAEVKTAMRQMGGDQYVDRKIAVNAAIKARIDPIVKEREARGRANSVIAAGLSEDARQRGLANRTTQADKRPSVTKAEADERRRQELERRERRRTQGLSKGGRVQYLATGGQAPATGGVGGSFDFSVFNNAVLEFGKTSSQLIEAMNNFPRTVTIQGAHTQTIIINGGQVFEQIKGPLTSLVEGVVTDHIKTVLSDRFAGSGPARPMSVAGNQTSAR